MISIAGTLYEDQFADVFWGKSPARHPHPHSHMGISPDMSASQAPCLWKGH